MLCNVKFVSSARNLQVTDAIAFLQVGVDR